VPSGILSLTTPAGSSVLYLTKLKSASSSRTATVNGGSFLGVPIGSLTGRSAGAGALTATIRAQGLGTLSVRFVRYSSKPRP
jgi:hypothetical protein